MIYQTYLKIFLLIYEEVPGLVISSSSGIENSFESAEWKNGVFTYSFLEGLKTKKADTNNDGKVSVSEIKDYIIDKVKFLTNGKQIPTSRKENIELDFSLF